MVPPLNQVHYPQSSHLLNPTFLSFYTYPCALSSSKYTLFVGYIEICRIITPFCYIIDFVLSFNCSHISFKCSPNPWLFSFLRFVILLSISLLGICGIEIVGKVWTYYFWMIAKLEVTTKRSEFRIWITVHASIQSNSTTWGWLQVFLCKLNLVQ